MDTSEKNEITAWTVKAKKSSLLKAFGDNLNHYLLNSSLHGLKYIGLSSITLFERIYFLLSFLLVFFLSAYFISNVYEKWTSTPVVITMSARATSITDIPFPAVTICNMNRARSSVVRNFRNKTFEHSLLRNFCSDKYSNESTRFDGNTGEWAVFKQFLLNISQPCNEMLVFCRYSSEVDNCLTLFETVLTDEGLCCIFNSVHPMHMYKRMASEEFNKNITLTTAESVDWTPEAGYPTDNFRNKRPRPATGTGSHLGLFVILNVNHDEYYCSSTNSAGFKILLHNPIESPQISNYGIFVAPGLETRIVVTPRLGSASNRLRDIRQEHRQCIFADEGNLTYFRTYSRRNCEMECRSRVIENKCGCVVYYMPRFSQRTKICGRADVYCYMGVLKAVERHDKDLERCSCLPGCYELGFVTDVSTAPIAPDVLMMEDEVLKNFSSESIQRNLGIIQIFYTDAGFRASVKEELTGFTDFLSNTGGLLGLFMGFSVVSIVEIIYFVALRPNFKRFYNRNKANKISNLSNQVKPFQRRTMIDSRKNIFARDEHHQFPYLN